MKKINLKSINFIIIIISLLPLFLLTGPFIPNLVVTICSIYLFYYLYTKPNLSFLNSKFFFLYFLFLILLILSSLFSDHVLNSLEHSLFYFRFILFSILFSILLNLNVKISIYLFYVLISIFLFLIVDGFLQYFLKFNFFMQPIMHNRISSIFGDEFILGSYLSRFLPFIIALFYFINFTKKYYELFLILFSLLTFLSVYFSGERIALLNAFISIFFLILLLRSKKTSYYFLSTYLFFTVYLLFFSNLLINNRIIQSTISQIGIFEKQKYFFSKYIDAYYHTAFNMFYANPILGVGPKNFRLFCDNSNYTHLEDFLDNCNNHPHNILIQLLSETGVITAILFVIFYLWITYNLLKYFIFSLKEKQNQRLKFYFFIFLFFFLNLSPFVPSGNFFNSWLNAIYYLPFAFILFTKQHTKVK